MYGFFTGVYEKEVFLEKKGLLTKFNDRKTGISNISDDMKALFKKRVYDISALTGKGVRVKYNGENAVMLDSIKFRRLFFPGGKIVSNIYYNSLFTFNWS